MHVSPQHLLKIPDFNADVIFIDSQQLKTMQHKNCFLCVFHILEQTRMLWLDVLWTIEIVDDGSYKMVKSVNVRYEASLIDIWITRSPQERTST